MRHRRMMALAIATARCKIRAKCRILTARIRRRDRTRTAAVQCHVTVACRASHVTAPVQRWIGATQAPTTSEDTAAMGVACRLATARSTARHVRPACCRLAPTAAAVVSAVPGRTLTASRRRTDKHRSSISEVTRSMTRDNSDTQRSIRIRARRLIDDRRALSDYSRYHVTRTLADIPAAPRRGASGHRTRATVQWIF